MDPIRSKSETVLAAFLALALAPCLAAYPDGLYALFHTSKGKIVCRLEAEKTPLTVTNFVALAEGKMTSATRPGRFYDGLTFHRVIADFMIQGGCPLGTGTGSPGYRFEDEVDTGLKHDGPGVLSMANAGPGTNGSQFFITHKATEWLDGKHTVFGRVIEGQDVVNKIAKGDKLDKLEILRVGKQAEGFVADQASFDRLKDKRKKASEPDLDTLVPGTVKTASGLRYVKKAAGSGGKPARGDKVRAHYEGRLVSGKVFDSSLKRNEPFEFDVGMGQVIKGWDEAFLDMEKGEKRTLVIPAELAYGSRSVGGGLIPAHSILIFEVELLDFKPKGQAGWVK